jgi:vacuolar-type H+-ATPase subunit H
MPDDSKPPTNHTRAQEIFKEAPEELQKLIRDILDKEREVMHRARRNTIHQDLYQAVKTFIR